MTDWYSRISKMGDGMIAAELPSVKTSLLKLPTPSLNWALSGGMIFGKIYTIYGPEQSGKSLIALLAVAEILKEDPEAWVVWYDAEYSFDKDYAEKLGVDTKRVLLIQSNRPEDIFDHFADKLWPMVQGAKGGEKFPLKAMVIDSIKGIRGPMEMSKETVNKQFIGDLAQLLNRSFRKILEPIRKGGILAICVQQVGEEMDQTRQMQGFKWHVPSGQALKHFSDVMILVEKVHSKASRVFDETHKNISDVPVQIGHIIRCKVDKNRTETPHLQAQFRLRYGVGVVDVPLEIAELAMNLGVVERPNSASYVFGGVKVIGFANFVKKITDTPELQRELLAAIGKVDIFTLANQGKAVDVVAEATPSEEEVK